MIDTMWTYINDNWIATVIGALIGVPIVWLLWTLPNKWIANEIRARKIAKILLKNNRPGRKKNGKFEPYADRFIDLWNSTSHNPQRFFKSNPYMGIPNVTSVTHCLAYDKVLSDLELVKLELGDQVNTIQVIDNPFNRRVYRLCRNFLIKKMGDDKEAYEDMERNAK